MNPKVSSTTITPIMVIFKLDFLKKVCTNSEISLANHVAIYIGPTCALIKFELISVIF